MHDFITEYRALTPTSQRLHERAQQVMPGGICHNLRYFAPHPFYAERVEGGHVWDVDGNRYLDLWLGHYALILGHRPAVVSEALQRAEATGSHWGIVSQCQLELAELLCRIIPAAEMVRFTVSGTESTMYAVRLARAHTGRRLVVKVTGGWHGANSELITAVKAPYAVAESAGLLAEETADTLTIPFNDIDGAVRVIREAGDRLAAVIIEAVGQLFIPPQAGYLEAVQEETKRAGALFILDEVITGFRLGLQGAQGRYGLQPDLFTMGKVVGGGMNVALVGGRREIMELASPTSGLPKGKGVSMGGGTYSCMPVAMQTALAMVRHLQEHEAEIYPALEAKGQRLRRALEEQFRQLDVPAVYLGTGSLYTVAFPPDWQTEVRSIEDVETKTDLAKRAQYRLGLVTRGVFSQYGGGSLCLAHTDEDIDQIVAASAEVLRLLK